MPDGLYEQDLFAWSEQQADLLRRVQAGERLNTPIDWDHLIAEVQDLGVSELNACRSLLRQALINLIKLHLSPEADAVNHWRAEVVRFLIDASDHYAPSMRQHIDVQAAFADSLRVTFGDRRRDEALREAERSGVVTACPYTLDELLTDSPDVDALVARLQARVTDG